MKQIQIRDEYITLGQFLKLCGEASSGIEAKMMILDEKVKVNGEIEIRRGKKLRIGDTITVVEKEFSII